MILHKYKVHIYTYKIHFHKSLILNERQIFLQLKKKELLQLKNIDKIWNKINIK